MTRTGVPDLKAAKKIPIEEVMGRLGIELHGGKARCWRPDNHQNGDRTPSVGIWRQKNKAKCFVCDELALSTLDVVMSVMNLDLFGTLMWLDMQFQLPHIPKGKHIARRSQSEVRFRVGYGVSLEPVVRSGLLAELTHSQVRVLLVLAELADPDTQFARMSYAGIRTYSGLGSDTSVKNALQGLESLHVIRIIRGRGGDGLPAVNGYQLTLDDSRFHQLLQITHDRTREEVAVQRKARAERRARLSSSFKANETPVSRKEPEVITGIKTVYSNCRAEKFPTSIVCSGRLEKQGGRE